MRRFARAAAPCATALLALALVLPSGRWAVAAGSPTVTVSGAPIVGQDLTAVAMPADGARYQWRRCDDAGQDCLDVAGASGPTYTVTAADVRHTLRAHVAIGPQEATSEPTGVVSPVYDIPAAPGEQTGSDRPGTTVTLTGPGQGSFSAGTQPAAGTTPPRGSPRAFIRPFPVVRMAGHFTPRRTTLTRVSVRAPRGVRVEVRCTGGGCPYRRTAFAARLIRVRALQRSYRPGAVIQVRVTKPRLIGKYVWLRMRSGNAPQRRDRCLLPGSTRPGRCPAA